MAKSWVLDDMSIAMSIKASGLPSAYCQHKDSLTSWECPQCSFKIDNCNWPGLPAGVKFDPSDVELLELLAAKYGVGNGKPNPYIDVFIPTLDVDEGICYKHPESLPCARKDGNNFHLFYRTKNAYASGQRKRRTISSKNNVYRWHKTGNTTTITNNKIHLGTVKDDEIEGALVVSKVFHPLTSLETPMYEDVSGAHVLQVPAESQTDDNVNLNDAARAVDSNAILNSSIGQDSVKPSYPHYYIT